MRRQLLLEPQPNAVATILEIGARRNDLPVSAAPSKLCRESMTLADVVF
ncbi:MAG: hypothetical protein WBP29_15305 [Candidatus Zixiibacteriota bacterium]